MNTEGKPRITVVGDVMLDRYLIGDVTRLNPEAPGVVLDIEREECRLGGAALVAMVAASLGAEVTLVGVVARDRAGSKCWTCWAPTASRRIFGRGGPADDHEDAVCGAGPVAAGPV